MNLTKQIDEKRWEIIKTLFLARRSKDLGQTEIAKKLGIGAMGLSYIEHGKRDIRLTELIKLADLLGYSLKLEKL